VQELKVASEAVALDAGKDEIDSDDDGTVALVEARARRVNAALFTIVVSWRSWME